jgi:transcriptional regulator with XRE-family HTH domain
MKERLKDLMDVLGVNKSTLASDMGLTPSAITDFFKGRSLNLSSSSLGKIAEKYHVNLNWLLTGEGEMFLPKNNTILPDVKDFPLEDRQMIKDIIESVTNIFNERNLSLPGKKMSELIFLLYDDLKNESVKSDTIKERALKLIKIAV